MHLIHWHTFLWTNIRRYRLDQSISKIFSSEEPAKLSADLTNPWRRISFRAQKLSTQAARREYFCNYCNIGSVSFTSSCTELFTAFQNLCK